MFQVISFIAENSLSLATAPKLIELARTLAKGMRTLENMTMDSSTASYKLKYGVARTFEEELVEDLKVTPFALNLDEAMNANKQKIVTVLVSYFSNLKQKIVLQHLKSFVMSKITSEGMFQKFDEMFENLSLP